MSDIRICSLCKHYRMIGKLSWFKNACGCEKRKWKLIIKRFSKEIFDRKLDGAKDCELFRQRR